MSKPWSSPETTVPLDRPNNNALRMNVQLSYTNAQLLQCGASLDVLLDLRCVLAVRLVHSSVELGIALVDEVDVASRHAPIAFFADVSLFL